MLKNVQAGHELVRKIKEDSESCKTAQRQPVILPKKVSSELGLVSSRGPWVLEVVGRASSGSRLVGSADTDVAAESTAWSSPPKWNCSSSALTSPSSSPLTPVTPTSSWWRLTPSKTSVGMELDSRKEAKNEVRSRMSRKEEKGDGDDVKKKRATMKFRK